MERVFERCVLAHRWHLVYSRVHFIASNFLTLAFKQMVCVCCVVLECEAVPKSTNLKKVVLDAGPANEGHLTVVTNASNIRVGTRTAVALVGSVVDDAGSEVTITKQVVKEKLAAKRAAKAGGEEGGAAEKEKEEAEEQDAGAGLKKLAL